MDCLFKENCPFHSFKRNTGEVNAKIENLWPYGWFVHNIEDSKIGQNQDAFRRKTDRLLLPTILYPPQTSEERTE